MKYKSVSCICWQLEVAQFDRYITIGLLTDVAQNGVTDGRYRVATNKQGPAGQRCVRMALKRHKGTKKAIKRPKALKGNDKIGLMKLSAIKILHFCIFYKSITYIHTDRPTNGRTRSYRDARTHLKSLHVRNTNQ